MMKKVFLIMALLLVFISTQAKEVSVQVKDIVRFESFQNRHYGKASYFVVVKQNGKELKLSVCETVYDEVFRFVKECWDWNNVSEISISTIGKV